MLVAKAEVALLAGAHNEAASNLRAALRSIRNAGNALCRTAKAALAA